MDIVEAGDSNGEQHAKAASLASRLHPPKALIGEVTPTSDDQAEEGPQEAAGAARGEVVDRKPDPATPEPSPAAQPSKPDGFDADLERRLEEAAAEARPSPGARKPQAGPRRRGRPRKEGTQ